MKKYLLIVFTSLLISALATNAQNDNDPILITINSEQITQSEFERIYKKNNSDSVIDQESLKEYLELFINFKLKVLEAEKLGLDTLKAFEIELNGYRRQLEKPYLTDNSIDEILFQEAYDRMTKDIKASHILIKLEENASAEDTARVYNKLIKTRNRIIKVEHFVNIHC